jgi:hypothetical protein
MADGSDNTNDKPQVFQAPDASAALFNEAHPEIPQKTSDNVVPTGEKTIATTTDYSKESPEVQARMNVSPEVGLKTAQENINNLVASISNSPEGQKAAADGIQASMEHFAKTNPAITEHIKTA